MRKNRSPWLHQLDAKRRPKRLEKDMETDIVIVGAGIAGISTAFFALKYTSKKVVIVERSLMAHGATGYNAGQVVSYFERGFASLVKEFGLRATADAERAIVDAWSLLDEMYTDAGLDIPFSRFLGHGGITSFQQVKWHLEANALRRKAGIEARRLLISEVAPFIKVIPKVYEGSYEIVPQAKIQELLETQAPGFIGVISFQKGCINSALFCQEVALYLQDTYKERFALYEHTPVHKLVLHKEHAIIDADTHTIDALRVVLCTNGFEDLHIINESGLEVDAKFHHLIAGRVGYMSGYLEKLDKQPIAISYYIDPIAGIENDYVYLTRRPFEYERGVHHNLVCVAGSSFALDDKRQYDRDAHFPEHMEQQIDDFVRKIYDVTPNKKITYEFTWHGLMGYTRNGVRLIGPEPQNPILLYNLGCNGVGILPSVHGGRQVARFVAGEKVPRSIFDVPRRVPGVSDVHATLKKSSTRTIA